MIPVEGESNTPNAIGCLGRALSLMGLAWVGAVVLAGLGILDRLGLSPALLAGLTGSIIPAFVLIAVGRAIRSRSRSETRKTYPVGVPAPGPGRAGPREVEVRPRLTPPILPGRDETAPTPPRQTSPSGPTMRPQPASEATTDSPRMEEAPGPVPRPEPHIRAEYPAPHPGSPGAAKPRTSQEMIEEAREKWGSKGR